MASDPEQEYCEALAAYEVALKRLVAAKKARPKPTIRANSLEHKKQVREAIWQAYLAGERNYDAMARRFGRTPGNVRHLIREMRRERAFGPITAKDHYYLTELERAREFHAARERSGLPAYTLAEIDAMFPSFIPHQPDNE